MSRWNLAVWKNQAHAARPRTFRRGRGLRVALTVLFALAGVLLLGGTSVAEPGLEPTLHPRQSRPTLPAPPIGYPTSQLDQRIFGYEDAPGQYFAAGGDFLVLFHLPTNPPLVTITSEEAWTTLSPRPVDPDAVQVEISANRIRYHDFFGPGADLEYVVAVNGVKERVVVESRSALVAMGSPSAEVFLNDGLPQTIEDPEGPEWERVVDGPIRLSVPGGSPAFDIPAGQAIPADAGSRDILSLPYLLRPYGDRLQFTLWVTPEILALPDEAYPLVLDPSIDPVSGPLNIADETVIQEAPLEILQGGQLTLTNVDLIFNESGLYFDVASGGSLVLSNTRFSTNGSYSFNGTVSGTLSATESTFESVGAEGIEVKGSSIATFDQSVFIGAFTGVKVTGAPNFGHIQDTLFDHGHTGIKIDGNFQLSGFTIQGNTFQYGEVGLSIKDSDVRFSSVTENTFDSLGTAGLVLDGSTGKVDPISNGYTDSYKGIAVSGGATLSASQETLSGNNFGVTVFESTATLGQFEMESVNIDLYDVSSTVTIVGGNSQYWVIDHQNGWLTLAHQTGFVVKNNDGTAASGITVTLTDAGGHVESSGSTNSQGIVTGLNATEYTTNGTFFGFFTPHLISVGSTSVHAVMDQDKTFTIYREGDADNDSRADSAEDMDRDVTWFELDGRALNYSMQHVEDFNASDGFALKRPVDNYGFILPTHTPPSRPGTYKLLVRARALAPDQILNVTVGDGGGNTLVSKLFKLDTEYRYYTTPSFTVDGYQKALPQFTDASQAAPGIVLVDRFALVRELDAQGNRTAALPGLVSDPLLADTDYDVADDGLEVFPGVHWFEAELANGSGEWVQSTAESNSWAVGHASGTNLVLNATIEPLYFDDGADVDAWIRARCLQGDSCNATLTLESGGDSASENVTVGQNWTWVNTSRLTVGDGALPVNITVEDVSDPDLNDSENYLLLDRFALADVAGYPSPAFFLTDPLDSDLDRDDLYDGHEVKDFFIQDKAQAEWTEDYLGFDVGTWGLGTSKYTHGEIEFADRYFSINFTTDRTAIWQVAAVGGFAVYNSQGSGVQPYLPHAYNLTMAEASSPENLIGESTANDARQARGDLITDPGNTVAENASTVAQRSYLLEPGTYRVNISLNMTLINFLENTQGYSTGGWYATPDFVLLQRKVLDPLDPDSDDDNVTDGVETRHGSYSLNNDSEHDNVSDWEEIYGGVDGRETNPLSEDTDADLLTDWQEIFGSRLTNAADADTDGDKLPDGWVDGFRFEPFSRTYITDGWYKDGLAQPWEGEDLDRDGSTDGGTFSYDSGTAQSTGGETDPLVADTDNDSIDDGWELRYKVHRLASGVPAMLNPLNADNASVDIDSDGLTNFQEYNFETDPYVADTDNDSIKDGDELRIAARTSIDAGAFTTAHYNESLGQSPYIFADGNPYDASTGGVYWYDQKVDNATLETRQFNGTFEAGESPAANETEPLFTASEVDSVVADRAQAQNGVYPYGSWFYKFEGNDTGTGNSHAYYTVYDVNIPVESNTHLQWKSFVLQAPTDNGRISLELKFTDGSYARDLGITDAAGNALHPNIHVNRVGLWERNDYPIGATAGKTIDKIAVAYDDEVASPATAKGWFTAYIDDIRVVAVNGTVAAALPGAPGNRVLGILADGSIFVLGPTNIMTPLVYVWSGNADLADGNDDGVLNGTGWVFAWGSPGNVSTSTLSLQGFRLRELRGSVDPLVNDSDADGILDGWDGPVSGSVHDWKADADADSIVNAGDTDSDGDGLPDGVENANWDSAVEPASGETNPYLNDTDADGILDGNDSLPADFDNDGLTGFSGFGGLEDTYGTDPSDADSDNDGLLDGTEDKNRNGQWDAIDETDALDIDTDGDGLWDGYSTFTGGNGTVRVEAESAARTGTGATLVSDSGASGGQKGRLEPNGTMNLTVNVTSPGLYQLNLTVADADNGTFENASTPTAIDNQMVLRNQVSGDTATRVQAENGVTPGGSYYFKLNGSDNASGNSYVYYEVFDVNEYVGANTMLFWRSYVKQAPTSAGRISIELWFTDQSYARDLGLQDAGGNYLHPAQHVNTIGVWETFNYSLAAVAGKTVDYIAVAYDDYGESGTATGAFTAYFEDIRIFTLNDFTVSMLPNAATGFRGASWNVSYNFTSLSGANWTNLSLGWFVRLPGTTAASYSLLVDCQASAGCYQPFFLDVVNLSKVRFAGEIPLGTNASSEDTDGDHVQDGTEWGVGWEDTLNTSQAQAAGYEGGTGSWFMPDLNNTTVTDPLRQDTDNDGLWDGWNDTGGQGDATDYRGEDYDGDGRTNQAATAYYYDSDPMVNDTDGDGLFDAQEYEFSGFTNASNWDTDGDLLPDGLEVGVAVCGFWTIVGQCIADQNTSSVTDPNDSDTDNDNRSDGAEDNNTRNGRFDSPGDFGNPNCDDLNPYSANACDTDSDGLTDGYETTHGTDETDSDSDNDGLLDGVEVAIGTNPNDATTDTDGWNDSVEVVAGTNPLKADTDSDGVNDDKEIDWNLDSDGDGAINARDGDSDNDGLSDGFEENGDDAIYDAGSSDLGNMTNPDTDGDGLTDYEDWWEDEGGLDCSFVKDADNDCLTGFSHLGYWYGGEEATAGTDFNLSDTDGDELTDYDEVVTYAGLGADPDPLDADTDNDGLTDGTEVLGWTFYFSNGASKLFTSNVTLTDTDGDGLNDTQEYGDGATYLGSDPRDPDTDHDGLCDKGNSSCTADNDNSTFDRSAPKIENVSLSVNSSWGFYYVRVQVSITDPSKIYRVVISFEELAPTREPEPTDDWAEEEDDSSQYAKKSMYAPVQESAPAVVENESVLVDVLPEGPSIDDEKFRYGYNHTWNIQFFETEGSATRFKNYTAVFTLTDRGILTEGYHILVEAMDWQGNINSVEKGGAIEKNWWEKVADKLKEFLDIAGAIAKAFLAWLVEAVGPIMGFLLMLLYSIAKNIVDMIFGIFQLIEMLVLHFNELIASFGMMFTHMGEVFKAMINQTIDIAETILPGSWKTDPKPSFDTVAQALGAFFADPFHFTATKRTMFAISAVAGTIVGFVVMNFLGGGGAVMGKIKSFAGLAKTTDELNGVTKAAAAGQKAAKASEEVTLTATVASKGGKATGGALAESKTIAKAHLFTEDAAKITRDAARSVKGGLRKADLEAFASKVDGAELAQRAYFLSGSGKLPVDDVNRLLANVIRQSGKGAENSYKGFANELRMVGRYSDEVPEGVALRLPPAKMKGQGDLLLVDEANPTKILGFREFKSWNLEKLLDKSEMGDLAYRVERGAEHLGASGADKAVEFTLTAAERASLTEGQILQISKPFVDRGIRVVFT